MQYDKYYETEDQGYLNQPEEYTKLSPKNIELTNSSKRIYYRQEAFKKHNFLRNNNFYVNELAAYQNQLSFLEQMDSLRSELSLGSYSATQPFNHFNSYLSNSLMYNSLSAVPKEYIYAKNNPKINLNHYIYEEPFEELNIKNISQDSSTADLKNNSSKVKLEKNSSNEGLRIEKEFETNGMERNEAKKIFNQLLNIDSESYLKGLEKNVSINEPTDDDQELLELMLGGRDLYSPSEQIGIGVEKVAKCRICEAKGKEKWLKLKCSAYW
ncbi:hypothetical protein AYI70_g3530 [Smittium culicis]|uniref:Uncharacterized protein n=1 Tax=Smittium culicis TaxID=133412 RepID=A0A1R1Y315_9FUNG|nr:hypothetical protein AYI70_g3530 [Smittium culicis]